MKKILDVSWNPSPEEATGFLHSLPRSFGTALRYAGFPYEHAAALTGFAFRIWVDGKTLCPSAMSIWNFGLIPAMLYQAGYDNTHVSRLWGQDALEPVRREEALCAIRASIERGVPVVAWDVGTVAEWGLVIGYDDDNAQLEVLDVTGYRGPMPYTQLGMRDIPILDLTALTGYREIAPDEALHSALTIAVKHAKGEEWASENATGLAAYPALAQALNPELVKDDGLRFSVRYYLGTYCDLRFAAWRYLDESTKRHPSLGSVADGYRRVFEALRDAFQITKEQEMPEADMLSRMAQLVREAGAAESTCIDQISRWLASAQSK